jgi:hypothetical protein
MSEDEAAYMNIGHWELERPAFELRHVGDAPRCTLAHRSCADRYYSAGQLQS